MDKKSNEWFIKINGGKSYRLLGEYAEPGGINLLKRDSTNQTWITLDLQHLQNLSRFTVELRISSATELTAWQGDGQFD